MKRNKFSILLAALKTLSAFLLISFLCLVAISMRVHQIAEDLVWKQLGLTEKDANININVSFADDHLQYAGAKNARIIALGDRVAVINQLVAYAKKYTGSTEFKNEYNRRRTIFKNEWIKTNPDPQQFIISADSIKAQERQRLQQQLKTAEDNLNSPNPKIKNGAPTAIENIKKQITALDDPNNPVIKRKVDDANRMANTLRQQYNEALQKFEAKYPEDPQVLLKKRLQEILDITADVDYAAELKDGYKGKKVFVNPLYEKKSTDWKLAFRAGKTATDAVRATAQQWIKELK